MSRIRSIKPEYWSSGQVMECSRDARLLFIGLWNFCDDAGRLSASGKQIKALVFPGDDDLNATAVSRMLDELSSNGLLTVYSVDGKDFLEVTGWVHQKIDKPQPAKYPPRPVLLDECSSNDRRSVSTEGRGSDRIGEDKALSCASASDSVSPLVDFQQAVVAAYTRAGSMHTPDTHRVSLWVERGYRREVAIPVIGEILAKKPHVPLKYFDGALADAHAPASPNARAGPQNKPSGQPTKWAKAFGMIDDDQPGTSTIIEYPASAAIGES